MRLFIMSGNQENSWQSCKVICSGLTLAYGKLIEKNDNVKIETCYLESDIGHDGLDKIIKTINDFNPSHIVWLEYQPHPIKFLKYAIDKIRASEICFQVHVYGDFVLFLNDWVALNEELKRFKSTKFLCSSHSQMNLVKTLLVTPENSDLLPFPIHNDDKKIDKDLAERVIKLCNLKKMKNVFLYTGRISHQKNVTALVEVFSNYQKVINKDSALIIVGKIDDIGNPYKSNRHPVGYQSFRFSALLEKYKDQNIFYFGDFEHRTMDTFYSVADHLVSLSTHHDEDFGMSVLEALVSGLSCGVTSWGGFRSFKLAGVPEKSIRYMTVTNKNGPKLRSENIMANLMSLGVHKLTEEEKYNQKKLYSNYFGIDMCAQNLKNHLNTLAPFNGFNKFAFKLSKRIKNLNVSKALLRKNHTFNEDYSKLYQSYFE